MMAESVYRSGSGEAPIFNEEVLHDETANVPVDGAVCPFRVCSPLRNSHRERDLCGEARRHPDRHRQKRRRYRSRASETQPDTGKQTKSRTETRFDGKTE